MLYSKYNKARHLPWLAYRVVSHQQECFHLFIYKILDICLLEFKLSILIVHEKSQTFFNMTANTDEGRRSQANFPRDSFIAAKQFD